MFVWFSQGGQLVCFENRESTSSGQLIYIRFSSGTVQLVWTSSVYLQSSHSLTGLYGTSDTLRTSSPSYCLSKHGTTNQMINHVLQSLLFPCWVTHKVNSGPNRGVSQRAGDLLANNIHKVQISWIVHSVSHFPQMIHKDAWIWNLFRLLSAQASPISRKRAKHLYWHQFSSSPVTESLSRTKSSSWWSKVLSRKLNHKHGGSWVWVQSRPRQVQYRWRWANNG